jgi:putative nucleotidyltransferase with HDIG domain
LVIDGFSLWLERKNAGERHPGWHRVCCPKSRMSNKRILFVGDQQPLWRELQNYSPDGWTAELACTESSALALLDQQPFDAVLVDFQMCGENGVEILDNVKRRQPKALRLILSDAGDTRGTVKCVGRAHQHLLKPCCAPTVFEALHHADALETRFPNEAVRELIGQMWWVPSPPAIYARILNETSSPEASVQKVADLVAQDPAVSAKILQLANSVMFALQIEVTQPLEAVTHVGLETTKAMVLLAHTFSSFDQLSKTGFSAEALWQHSVTTGQIARRIVDAERAGILLEEEAFAAGLLHDIGKLLFAANLPGAYAEALALARARKLTVSEAEARVFGASHAEVGACLLGIWGLPLPLVDAVQAHHSPGRQPTTDFTSLTAVHTADILEHETARSAPDLVVPELDIEYLERLGLEHRLEAWRKAAVLV